MTLILVDAKNLIYRMGWSHRNLTTTDGIYTGASYGILNAFIRLKDSYPDARFVMVWDGMKAKSEGWRTKLYPEYKGNRNGDPPEDIKRILSQIPLVKKLLDVIKVLQVNVDAVEADDMTGLIAHANLSEHKIIVYSSDYDFLQLMQYGVNVIRGPNKHKEHTFDCETTESVYRKFGCTPVKLLGLRAIVGDKSDNIAGAIRGVGEVRAAQYIKAGVDPGKSKPPSIDPKLASGWAKIRLNYRLMTILTPATMEVELDEVTQEEVKAELARVQGSINEAFKHSSQSYKAMLDMFTRYELNNALENRRKFLLLNR